MTEVTPRPAEVGSAAESAGSVITDAGRYVIILAHLGIAGMRLAGLGEAVRSTYRYLEKCSHRVDRLADQAAALEVDRDTVAEHHDAAAVMRSVLAAAEAMAAGVEELSALFYQTRDAHQADYGPVADAVHAMPVPMAKAEFYSNR